MSGRGGSIVSGVVILLVITALVWPVLIGVATALGMNTGEAWQIDAWAQEPRRRLLASALQGWRQALPWSLGIGLLAVLDRTLLGLLRASAWAIGITLPVAGAVLAFLIWPEPSDALVTLVLTGVVLIFPLRLIDALARRFA